MKFAVTPIPSPQSQLVGRAPRAPTMSTVDSAAPSSSFQSTVNYFRLLLSGAKRYKNTTYFLAVLRTPRISQDTLPSWLKPTNLACPVCLISINSSPLLLRYCDSVCEPQQMHIHPRLLLGDSAALTLLRNMLMVYDVVVIGSMNSGNVWPCDDGATRYEAVHSRP